MGAPRGTDGAREGARDGPGELRMRGAPIEPRMLVPGEPNDLRGGLTLGLDGRLSGREIEPGEWTTPLRSGRSKRRGALAGLLLTARLGEPAPTIGLARTRELAEPGARLVG